jgi:transcriptional regulator with XRE-family HTH domain
MKKITPKKLSDSVPGLSQNLAAKYLRGYCRPTLQRAIQIEEAVGIPVKAWMDIQSYLKKESGQNDHR